MDHTSKKFQDFVIDYTIKDIQKHFKFKTKKEAKEYFFKALAYNTVQEEIFTKIEFILEKIEK